MPATTLKLALTRKIYPSSYKKFAKYKNGLDDALLAIENNKLTVNFACDCAERVLPLYEKHHPDEKCLRKAIKTARKYINGKASEEKIGDAQTDAWFRTFSVEDAPKGIKFTVKDAPLVASWDAGVHAAWATYAAASGVDSTTSAVMALLAASNAAEAVACAAWASIAWGVVQAEQNTTRSDARTAWDEANAYRVAARDAEREWQLQHLTELLRGVED